MKKLIYLLLVMMVTVVTLNAQKSLPDVELPDLDGKMVNVSDFGENGKITVFSFWATWCSPCKKELNNIKEYYEDWQDDYDVEIVAISIDDKRAASRIKPYVNGQNWEYTVLHDSNEEMKRALNFQTVPYTVMVNQAGEVVYEHTGYVEGDEFELEEKIAKLAEEGSSTKEEKKDK